MLYGEGWGGGARYLQFKRVVYLRLGRTVLDLDGWRQAPGLSYTEAIRVFSISARLQFKLIVLAQRLRGEGGRAEITNTDANWAMFAVPSNRHCAVSSNGSSLRQGYVTTSTAPLTESAYNPCFSH